MSSLIYGAIGIFLIIYVSLHLLNIRTNREIFKDMENVGRTVKEIFEDMSEKKK